jgi:hypothetical protein
MRIHRTGIVKAACGVLLLAGTFCSTARAEDDSWPREIKIKSGTIVMYQPQPERFVGNDLSGRAAISYHKEGEAEPVFGAVWVTARVEIDREAREVTVLEVKVDRVRFPDATPEKEKQLSDLLEREIPKWQLSISLDRLLVSIDQAEKEEIAATELKNDPPKIMFVDHPAILISIDGEPILEEVENSTYMRVVNTLFLIALDTKTKTYYLDGGEIWFKATDARGPWTYVDGVPLEVLKLRPPRPPEEEKEAAADAKEEVDQRIPAVIVATSPTELIVSDGKPTWTPIADTDLMYMKNSESDVVMEISTQRKYVVLSGRWYVSASLSGPWSYVASNKLPAGFAKIPAESEVGHLLVFVAGTGLAKEAVLDSQIPQTAAIKRSATIVVTYDGKPDFEKIKETDLRYATNTTFAVIKFKKKYYACHEAVWYVADDPLGPWKVATEIPREIYTIPPSCPIYNVKYVHIYDVSDEVVYVGYYPGYTGSYVYGGTVVYGTGYYYPAHYHTVYVAYPVTWGFHVHYNPWYGWGFGWSWSTGRVTISVGWVGHRHGWWGYGGHYRYRRGYHRGWHHGYRAGARAGYRAGSRPRATPYRGGGNRNVYQNQNNRARNANQPRASQQPNRAAGTNRPNNVYADKNGNVHRKQGDTWQKRDRNGWSSSGNRSQASSRPLTGTGRGGSSMNRDAQNRSRGSQRSKSYQRSRGGSRGGGRRP